MFELVKYYCYLILLNSSYFQFWNSASQYELSLQKNKFNNPTSHDNTRVINDTKRLFSEHDLFAIVKETNPPF